MEIAGRTVGVDSVICGQKTETPGYDSISPRWHHTVLYRYMLGGVRVCKSVKNFLPLYDAGNKGLPWQAVACTPTTTAIHRRLQPHSWGKASKQKLLLPAASLLQPGQVILPE